MENCLMDRSGTLPAKSIIFAMTKNHAKRLVEAFYKIYPDYPGLAKVIISDDHYAQKAIEDFEKEELPRIAISVDMLDSGVDIEEVCNLVFAKPVFSRIKFWQMLGRGTRVVNDPKEHNFDWVPDEGKEYFKVFDFWNVFEHFNMKPEGDESHPAEAVSIRLFKAKVDQLAFFINKKHYGKAEEVKQKIGEAIDELPMDSSPIRERSEDIEKAKSDDFYNRKGLNPIQFLHTKIAPLMKFRTTNYDEASFILKCEKLALAILTKDSGQSEKFAEQIAETLECIPENLNALNVDLLREARRNEYWDKITYEDAQRLITEFGPFIKYKTKEPRQQIIVDLEDVVVERTIIQFGPDAKEAHVESYKESVERRIKDLAKEHPTIRKIKLNEKLTDEDIEKLEDTLNSPELYFTSDVLKQFYKGTFVQFIKEVLGLYKEEDSEEKIKKRFEAHLIENNKQYNADQFEFIRTLQTFFIKEKHIDYDMLWDPPFENLGFAPTDVFPESELKEWIDFCDKLEAEH
jgi:type I restriction enzyme R subunit